MLPRLQRIPGRKAKMPSKPDRSESQLNRYTSRALELLKWIGDELGHDEFSLEQILDTAPLDDPVKPEEVANCERRIARLDAIFARLEVEKRVESVGKNSYVMTDSGKRTAEWQSMLRLRALFNAASYSQDRVRWSSLCGKPFDEQRTDEELGHDMLVRISFSSCSPPFENGDFVGLSELVVLRDKQRVRRQQLNERARITAAFNLLREEGYIDSDGDEIYSITIKGDQYLESAA